MGDETHKSDDPQPPGGPADQADEPPKSGPTNTPDDADTRRVSDAAETSPGVSERAEGAIDRLLQSPALSWLADDIRPIEERYNSGPAATTDDVDGGKSGAVAEGDVLPPGARLPRPAPEPEPEPEPPPRKPRPEPGPPDAMDKILDALIRSRPLRWAISLAALVLGVPAVLGIWVLDPITQTTHTLASDETSTGAVVDIVQCWHTKKSMVYAVELIETAADGTRRFETLGYANQKVWAGAELNVVGEEAFIDFPDGPLWARTSVSSQESLADLRSMESADPYPQICK